MYWGFGIGALAFRRLWDHGAIILETKQHAEEGGQVHTDYHTVRHTTHWGWLLGSDQTAGMLFAVAAACLYWAKQSYGLKLAAEIGGTVRH